jgi:hypothetical protein
MWNYRKIVGISNSSRIKRFSGRFHLQAMENVLGLVKVTSAEEFWLWIDLYSDNLLLAGINFLAESSHLELSAREEIYLVRVSMLWTRQSRHWIWVGWSSPKLWVSLDSPCWVSVEGYEIKRFEYNVSASWNFPILGQWSKIFNQLDPRHKNGSVSVYINKLLSSSFCYKEAALSQ